MTYVHLLRMAAVVAGSAALLAACGGQTSGPAGTASPTPTPTPTPNPHPPPTATPTPPPTPTATPTAAAPVLLAQSVGTMGTILVAASNMHTVYTFDSDSPGAKIGRAS